MLYKFQKPFQKSEVDKNWADLRNNHETFRVTLQLVLC